MPWSDGQRGDVRHSSHQAVADSVAETLSILAKCWSEWQDLNLRPPRPERGGTSAVTRAVDQSWAGECAASSSSFGARLMIAPGHEIEPDIDLDWLPLAEIALALQGCREMQLPVQAIDLA